MLRLVFLCVINYWDDLGSVIDASVQKIKAFANFLGFGGEEVVDLKLTKPTIPDMSKLIAPIDTDVSVVGQEIGLPSELQQSLNRNTNSQSSSGPLADGQNIVSPAERITRGVTEQTTTNRAEVILKDATGRAEILSSELGDMLTLERSGAFS